MSEMNIDSLIAQKIALSKKMAELKAKEDSVKAEIKLCMTSLKQEKYEDKDGNIVTLREQTRETVDKKRVKELLGELKFAEVLKSSTFPVLKVISAENREKMKSFLS